MVPYPSKTLRADTYTGLQDFLASAAAAEGVVPGKNVVLSSSFAGGPRAMQQSYQDAMAICRKYGKPDIFLTATCNPKTKDITDNLFHGQRASDRPDIVAKVFKLELDELLEDLLVRDIFGRVVGYVYVIEFQKRGLPHVHMLLILDEEDKIRSIEMLDRIVSCEIPDPNVHPRLYFAIQKLMVHGPCGEQNPVSSCMIEGTCSKLYPKTFCSESSLNVDGFPLYKRPNNGRTLLIKGKSIDNRWIVPHNPFLIQKYNSHINVEICSSVKSFKYLYKYIFKGMPIKQLFKLV